LGSCALLPTAQLPALTLYCHGIGGGSWVREQQKSGVAKPRSCNAPGCVIEALSPVGSTWVGEGSANIPLRRQTPLPPTSPPHALDWPPSESHRLISSIQPWVRAARPSHMLAYASSKPHCDFALGPVAPGCLVGWVRVLARGLCFSGGGQWSSPGRVESVSTTDEEHEKAPWGWARGIVLFRGGASFIFGRARVAVGAG